MSFAEDDISIICKDFTANIENSTHIDNSPFKKGMLWKIETPQGKINYLFGTMHSQDYAISQFPPEVKLALVKSKTLLIETIPSEQANQTFIDNMYFKDEQRLDNLLEKVLFEELKNKIEDYGVEKEQLTHLKP